MMTGKGDLSVIRIIFRRLNVDGALKCHRQR